MLARDDAAKGERGRYIEDLAEAMVRRHIRNSLPTSHARVSAFGEPGWRTNSAPRVLFVVGAGASASRFLRSEALRTHLIERLEHSSMREYEAEVKRLQRIWNMTEVDHDDPDKDNPDFETTLAALARTPHRAQLLREEISEQYRVRHPTQLGYEVLAHLLKHRFIDGIINFNFDELLDQSLLDEVGEREFVSVVSPRDVPAIPDFRPEDNRYRPIYVKPHGTVSDPPTLRFTRQAYDEVPSELQGVIKKMFGSGPVVLVSLGYSMRDFDFLETLPSRPFRLYNLSYDAMREADVATLKRFAKRVEVCEPDRDAWLLDEGEPSADKAMCHLFAKMEDEVAGLKKAGDEQGGEIMPVYLRSIERHRAIVRLLTNDEDLTVAAARVAYLERRAVLEAAFALVRGRGLLSISALARDRVAQYHDLAKQAGSRASWTSILAAGGIAVSALTPQTYLPLDKVVDKDGDEDNAYRTTHFHDIDHAALADHVLMSLRDGGEPKEGEAVFLAELFNQLARGTEIEIHSTDDEVCSRVYVDPKICTTLTALRSRTFHMLERDSMSHLAVSAESGEWLCDGEVLAKSISRWIDRRKADDLPWRILLLVGFLDEAPTLEHEDVFGPARGDEDAASGLALVHQAWWRQNQRSSIALESGVPLEAVSFARRQRSVYVTPVHLHSGSDARRAWQEFQLSCTSALRSTLVERLAHDDPAVRRVADHPTLRRILGSSEDHEHRRVRAVPPTAVTPQRILSFDEMWQAARMVPPDTGD
ncbi:MAG TPA: SIR2 family protein [Iamia sp.]